MKIIDIAYKYRFGSPEHFVRTFKKVWNETPTEYKKHWKFSEIYPKLDYIFEEGADREMASKKVDISEMYEEIMKAKDTYVICVDIVGLIPINDISYEAGDLAILEAARRIDNISTEEMFQLRIGGDEFALITGSSDLSYVEGLVEGIISRNGESIEWDGKKIPLKLRAGIMRASAENIKYDKLFYDMHKTINEVRTKE